MTNTQIKDYLKKYRIDSEESLAKHIEELKRNTKPNNEIIFPLVDLLVNEKSVLNSFFAENKKQEMFTRTVTPFLGEMLGKCSTQCFCDGSCKKPQEKKLGGYVKPNVYVNSTRHKAREEGKFHKGIVGDLEGINRLPSKEKIIDNINSVLNNWMVRNPTDGLEMGQIKDDVITSNNRGEKETMEYLQSLKQKQEWVENRIKEDKKLIEEFGVKHNQLKPRLDVVINTQFPKALQLIALATEYGNSKYKETDLDMLNFKRVAGGSQTYFDSCARHSTDRNGLDESGLPHIIHAVWSSLAGLELWAEENRINVKEFTENYMKNLQD